MNPRVLFILKRREDFDSKIHNNIGLETGLYNSAKFVNDMLISSGFESKQVIVIDNNDIDREISNFKPTHVMIEALWVVPSKFIQLTALHPSVKWIIRLHSEMPFMANEGIAMDWIADYSSIKNVFVACNAPRMLREVEMFLTIRNNGTSVQVPYLPNFYLQTDYLPAQKINYSSEYINVGCFGAIRPLKNQLSQAFAALEFARNHNRKLRFHINSGRIEMKGEPILHNLKGLFEQLSSQGHELINHTWCPRAEFLSLCSQMDIGMQVSFSETFNIVAADMIVMGIPLVGSVEIPWLPTTTCEEPTDTTGMVKSLSLCYQDFNRDNLVKNAQTRLTEYTDATRTVWCEYLNN